MAAGGRPRRSTGSFPRGSQAAGGPCVAFPQRTRRTGVDLSSGSTQRGSAGNCDPPPPHRLTPAAPRFPLGRAGVARESALPAKPRGAEHSSLDLSSCTALSWDIFHSGTDSSGSQHGQWRPHPTLARGVMSLRRGSWGGSRAQKACGPSGRPSGALAAGTVPQRQPLTGDLPRGRCPRASCFNQGSGGVGALAGPAQGDPRPVRGSPGSAVGPLVGTVTAGAMPPRVLYSRTLCRRCP